MSAFQTPPRRNLGAGPPSVRRRTRTPYVSPPRPRPIGRTRFQLEQDADEQVRRRLVLPDIPEDSEVQTPQKQKRKIPSGNCPDPKRLRYE